MSLIGETTRRTESRGPTGLSPLREKKMMEARATSRLHHSPYHEIHAVTCEFHEGMLSLRGCVPSYYLKQIAQTVVLESWTASMKYIIKSRFRRRTSTGERMLRQRGRSAGSPRFRGRQKFLSSAKTFFRRICHVGVNSESQ